LGYVQTGIVPEFILFFDVPMDEMERRILGRNQGRVDDNIETLKKRLKVFVESSLPVVKYYDAMGKVHKVNATKSVDDVFETIRPLFKRYEQVTGPIYLLCLLSFIHHRTRVF
jgi:UMP-CMP kinase